MDTQQWEKFYVAVGNDLQEGLGSLGWALRNLPCKSTKSIIILHFDNSSKDFVDTPFGKFPSSSVNDEMLGAIRRSEQEKIDKLLSKFIALCTSCKVRAEVLKLEKSDEPIHILILGLMSSLRITKLVMGIRFMKSLPWRGKSSIGGSFYVHKNKPDFCELFIICGGKLVHLREENEDGIVGNDQKAVMVKEKATIRGWFLGKMSTNNNSSSSSSSVDHYVESRDYVNHVSPSVVSDWWENYAEEIENYFQLLLNSNLEEEIEEESCEEEDGVASMNIPSSSLKLDKQDKADINADAIPDKNASIRSQIVEAQKTIEENRKETKANIERRTNAERIISLCTRRAEELEARMSKEIADQIVQRRELEAVREELHKVSKEIKENKNRLKTISELQSELAKKLQSISIAKTSSETQLENAVAEREEIVQDIDSYRSQKDILRQRIDFCREIEAVNLTKSINLNYNYREFKVDEIKAATSDFSECMRLKCRGGQTSIFKGKINHTSVAIKYLHNSLSKLSQEEFKSKMSRLYQLRHPHVITMIGACSEPKCIVYEYMHRHSLQDILSSSSRQNRNLTWVTRIRIAFEVSLGLGFLHSVKPGPIIHGNLNTSNILLDRNLVVKIGNCQLQGCEDESTALQSDISDFGVIMLQLLTGGGDGVVEEVTRAVECKVLIEVLDDEMAREWPLDLADEFVGIALRCVQVRESQSMEVGINEIMKELNELKKKAEQVVVVVVVKQEGGGGGEQYGSDVPNIFLCPIFQEVMKNPHVAADGFTYELEAIEEWMATGHETSPMTNLKLNHKLLTPNHTIRSLIWDWNHNVPSSSHTRVLTTI